MWNKIFGLNKLIFIIRIRIVVVIEVRRVVFNLRDVLVRYLCYEFVIVDSSNLKMFRFIIVVMEGESEVCFYIDFNV